MFRAIDRTTETIGATRAAEPRRYRTPREINDLPFVMRGRGSPDEWEKAVRRTFDVLYREGAGSGRVMAIPLHPFITGVPHRIDALDAALAYICRHDDVWLATGSEIVEAYLASGATI